MKKIIFILSILIISLCPKVWAVNQPIIYGDTVSAINGLSITSNVASQNRSRAVWVGTTQSIDLSFDGSNWITFQGATAGTLLPLQVVGARKTAGSASPTAGDIVFLY